MKGRNMTFVRRLVRRVRRPGFLRYLVDEAASICTLQRWFATLPYDNSNAVIYDKDDTLNCYTDEYVMALASSSRIKLLGITTSSSIAPFNPYVTAVDYERFVRQRSEIARYARNSGLRHIPDPIRGTKGHLHMPASGRIEDTEPLDSEGSRLIVEAAKRTEPPKPVVIVLCAGLTIAANAYLLHPSIAENIVLAFFGGRKGDMGGYNGWSDPWAAYIALCKLRLVQFSERQAPAPYVPKQRLLELPDTEFRKWMIDKRHPNGSPGSQDADSPPMIALTRRDYVRSVTKVSFSHWKDLDYSPEPARQVVAFRVDPTGPAMVVSDASQRVATQEWWRTMKDPAVWG